jgi:hypothetical protein
MFQLNAGNGIGRYVNDLKSVGSFDGIFNPANGKLKLFDVVAQEKRGQIPFLLGVAKILEGYRWEAPENSLECHFAPYRN